MMTESEAKEVIREHARGESSNVRQLLEAWEVGCKVLGDVSIDALYKWAEGDL